MARVDVGEIAIRFNAIGGKIKEARGKKPLIVMADEIGISKSQLSRIERGQEPPSVWELMVIAEYLLVTPGALMGYEDDNDLFKGCSIKEKEYLKRKIKFEREEYEKMTR